MTSWKPEFCVQLLYIEVVISVPSSRESEAFMGLSL